MESQQLRHRDRRRLDRPTRRQQPDHDVLTVGPPLDVQGIVLALSMRRERWPSAFAPVMTSDRQTMPSVRNEQGGGASRVRIRLAGEWLGDGRLQPFLQPHPLSEPSCDLSRQGSAPTATSENGICGQWSSGTSPHWGSRRPGCKSRQPEHESAGERLAGFPEK